MKMIDLGSAMEETKGSEFNSVHLDGTNPGKKVESGLRYRSAPPELADGIVFADQN